MATKSYKDKITINYANATPAQFAQRATDEWSRHLQSIIWGRIERYTYEEREIIIDYLARHPKAVGI